MEAEPSIEFLLAKNDGIEGLLLGRHRVTIHQTHGNAIGNAKALPKLSFSKNFDRLLRIGAPDTFS